MSADRPDLSPLIDHALLDPHQGSTAIRQCCEEARHFGFAGVCVASRWVDSAREHLPREGKGPSPSLIAVVGFPFGAVPAAVKQAEAEAAAASGADELDVVPDFGSLADRRSTPIHDELAAIAAAEHDQLAPLVDDVAPAPVCWVPMLPGDVHDVAGLHEIRRLLFGPDRPRG